MGGAPDAGDDTRRHVRVGTAIDAVESGPREVSMSKGTSMKKEKKKPKKKA
jgi:hypothetical protein